MGLVGLVSVIAFEALAVATAMPEAVTDLGGLREYSLAFSLFLTASLFGSVTSGVWGDRRGPRAPAFTGFALFAAGLLVSGSAGSYAVLLVGRLVSGLGAGLLSVVIYLVVAAVYPTERQPRMFSAVSAAWVLPSLVGPALAGLLTTHLSWRAVFLAALPLLAVVLPMLGPHLRRAPVQQEAPDAGRRLLRGAVLAVSVSLLQAGLVTVTTATGAALAVAGAVGTAAALPGLLPVGVGRAGRGLPALVLARTCYAGTFFGAEAFLPLMLVSQRGLSTGEAGLMLTVGAIGWSTGAWWQGRVADTAARARLTWVGGLLLGLAVPLVALGVWPAVPPVALAPVWMAAALGMGLGMSSTSVLLIRLSVPAEQGRNASSMQIGDGLGGVLGIGAAGAVFAALHTDGGGPQAFVVIWLGLGLLGLASALAAARIGTGSRTV